MKSLGFSVSIRIFSILVLLLPALAVAQVRSSLTDAPAEQNSDGGVVIPGDDCAGGIIQESGVFDNGRGNTVSETVSPFSGLADVKITKVCNVLSSFAGPVNVDYDVVIYAADGAGGEPGTELYRIAAPTAAMIPIFTDFEWFSTVTDFNQTSGDIYIGIDQGGTDANPSDVFLGSDGSTPMPLGQYYDEDTGVWTADIEQGAYGVRLIVEPLATGTFTVAKDFSDDNPASVDFGISCTNATIIDGSGGVSGADKDNPAVFTLEFFASDNPTCTATEISFPPGYTPDESACSVEIPLVADGNAGCTIVNNQNPVQITVEKEYTDGNTDAVSVSLVCSSGTPTPASADASPGSPAVFMLEDFDVGGATCTATEASAPTGYYLESSTCDDMQLDLAGGARCVLTNAPGAQVAAFEVQKRYMDGNDDVPVTLNISCNTGLPIKQSQTVFPDNQGNFGNGQFEVKFIVESFANGELDCTVSEEPAEGYSGSYNCASDNATCSVGGPSGIPNDSFYEGPCVFEDVLSESAEGATAKCVIRNYPDPVPVIVEKEWIFEGPVGGIDTNYQLTLFCEAEILGAGPCLIGPPGPEGASGDAVGLWCEYFNDNAPAIFEVEVIPEYPNSHCWVEETIYDSAVEVDNGCENLTVSVGSGASCVVTNTVFFEGIPTLSQFGMAILALLMLTVGWVGFRRFV